VINISFDLSPETEIQEDRMEERTIRELVADEGMTTTTSLEAPLRRITRSMSRGESSISSSLSLFCITLV